jgi:peptidoglycan hydrolase-like amidase
MKTAKLPLSLTAILLILFSVFSLQFSVFPSFARECNEGDPQLQDICLQLNKLEAEKASLEKATAGVESSLKNLEDRINLIQKDINTANAKLKQLESEILDREVDLEVQKKLLAAKVRDYYISSHQFSPLLIFLASTNAAELTRELFYRQSVADQDKKIIIEIAQALLGLKNDQEDLENRKASLARLQADLDAQAAPLRKDLEGAKAYEQQLSSKIAELTAKQQAILSARAGTFTTSVGEVPISNIPCSGPPGSPSYCDPGGGTWFAGFSFGAWTHRKGMSQYGAKGRADNGQNFEQILQAYYGKTPVGKDTGGTIAVDGYGNLDFENYYLMGIAEMPSSWHPDALKAQAVAARTYAYRYKIEGRSICASQSCQVFSKSKADSPPAEWRAAVEQTRGLVIEDVVTFYSSTAGGYLTTMGWDTTDGQGGPGFATRAWESKAGSPWFYSAWFTESYSAGSAKCGRSHPWLSEEEMADILNAWLVLNKEGGDDRILPVTINQCPLGGISGNPYSISELRDKANGLGGAFTSVSSASVSYSNNGETSAISFSTNKGSVSISGSEFKQAFNLRAPGYIALRSPLFNLEKK